MRSMQNHDLLKKHSIRQHVQIVPTPSDREVVLDAQRRLVEDPEDADALFAVAAWDEIVGDLVNALDLLNRLVSAAPDYPGVWWLRARILKDLGRERDAMACERIARIYAEPDIPQSVRKFPL
ncbi:hypothetical protein AUG86_03655 [Euryarchaeota archaeon 13_1_20CM_4_64_14]|nr:MAG: hypothetical protein AUG86_03655 [Euryarchaeota archaeon 13_1_20CM_4_64_14]